jgi:competence protein ComEC
MSPGDLVGRDRFDLRLPLGALAAWLALLVGGSGSARASLLLGVGFGVLGVIALVLGRRRWSAFASEVGLASFCVALVLVPLAGRIARADSSTLSGLAMHHTAVTAVLTVAADPRQLAAKGVAGSARVAVETDAERVSARGRSVAADGSVLVLGPALGWADVLPGQRVQIDGTLQPSLDSHMSVTLFTRGPPTLIGKPPWWQRAAGHVRAALRRAAAPLPADERGLLPGLVDGDTTGLDPVLADHFRTAGLTHLVAVSGTNCSIVIGAVVLLLRRARARPLVTALVGLTVLVAFVVIARPSPSVLRAAVMSAVALTALATGRPKSGLPALAAAVIVLLIWDPLLATDLGFAMSVLATASLLVLAPSLAKALRRRRVPIGIAELIAVAAAAHVDTAPLVVTISSQVSLVAIPANVLAEPVVAVATVLGFAAAAIAPVWMGAGVTLAWLAGWPCRWLVGVANLFGEMSGATIPWPGSSGGAFALLAILIAIGVLIMWRRTRLLVVVALLVAVVIQIPVRTVLTTWPPSGWVFVACDIGQGDALLLNAGNGSAVEVDAGPDPVSIDRCLRELDVRNLPLVAITHDHLDHVAGLPGAAHGRRIGRLIAGPLDAPESGASILSRVARERGLSVSTPPPGTHLRVGDVDLDVLGPVAAFHNTHSDPNNSSLVMRATVRGVRILLSGDVEVEAQRALVEAHVDLRADVLKVAHHGSAYFDPDYYAAVHPRVAVISVGLHNDYGHPSPLTLRELGRLGIPVSRTDKDGSVAVVSDGHGALSVVASGKTAVSASRAATLSGSASEADGRMPECRPAPSPLMICPARYRASSCSSATRSTWSTEASARSPPPSATPTLRLSRRSWLAINSRAPH